MKKYLYLLPAVQKLPAGQAYAATQGSEFDCQPESFRQVVYGLAKEKGRDWRGTATVIKDTVFYAFYKNTDYLRPNLPAYPVVKKAKGEL